MASQYQVKRRQTTSLGRSGPRSRSGCQTCKARRVRCDEKHPVCSHCHRLQLECVYRSVTRSSRKTHNNKNAMQRNEVLTTPVSPAITSQFDESNGLDGVEVATPEHGSSTSPQMIDTPQHLCSSDDKHVGTNNLSGVPSLTTMLETEHIDVLNAVESVGSLWHNEQPDYYLDYISVPDPPFTFTSLEFGNSPDLFSDYSSCHPPMAAETTQINVQPWSDNASDQNEFNPITAVLTNIEEGQDDSSTLREGNGRSPAIQTSALVPLMSATQQQTCFTYFDRDVRPPASLAGIDPHGWLNIKRYILKKAQNANKIVLDAFFAISTLLSATDMTFQSSVNRHNYRLLAIRLHQAACACIELTLTRPDWEAKHSHDLLAAVFLLAWFEIAYDDDDKLRPSFPVEMAAKVIVDGQDWNQGSTHVLQWLNLMDSKISHLGGRVLFSEPALQVIRRAHCEVSHPEMNEDSNCGHFQVQYSEHGTAEVSERHIMTPSRNKRLDYLLSSRSQSAPPPNVIRMDIFNIILYPAFELHLTSMSFARRIGGHDRHHRSRDTPEDEFEVMEACRGFEEELQELWRHRPGILNLDASQLQHFVSKDIARELELLFSVYIATFWSHFIYIHRVAFWSLKHTAIVEKALEETGNMMRRSVCQSMDRPAFDESIPRTVDNTIHPGLMWTCLIFGCEIQDPVQQNWSVAQLRALGKLSPADYKNRSDCNSGVLPFRIDKKGQQNALKVSRLLSEIIDRQEKTKGRIDGRYLSQELFGCTFYMI
ncbi:hypothetical protein F5Y07DRAFT_378289 [Xylaria sp. FL0933]|nr:hypothetical protein F5Y07DRAFT_378289 [Xylaria sp. FL0933]